MRVAASQLAWHPAEEAGIADLFGRLGVTGVELAPTKVFAAPAEAAPDEVRRYRASWNDRGVEVVAMQALLFGHPEFALFGTDADRERMGDYLARIIALGGALGAGALVFGSPGNRRRGELAREAALEIASAFFRRMGEVAADHGTILCIEPNPPHYACDFVTTVAEGAELVDRVAHPGFGLHLDAGGMTLNGETPADVVPPALSRVRHFHVSEPQLAPIGEGGTDHAAMADALRGAGYAGWVSVEMKPAGESGNDAHVERALRLTMASYS